MGVFTDAPTPNVESVQHRKGVAMDVQSLLRVGKRARRSLCKRAVSGYKSGQADTWKSERKVVFTSRSEQETDRIQKVCIRVRGGGNARPFGTAIRQTHAWKSRQKNSGSYLTQQRMKTTFASEVKMSVQ